MQREFNLEMLYNKKAVLNCKTKKVFQQFFQEKTYLKNV